MDHREEEQIHIFRKADLILIIALVVFGFAFSLFLLRGSNEGHVAEVSVDGEIVKELPLSKDGNFMIETPGGVNMVVVKDGKVYVGNADCPDQVCVKTGKIAKPGETIICLPHKMIVEVKE